jgi:hypothetical protein
MTHEDAGHYAKKHQGIKIDKKIEEELKKSSENEKISCPIIHSIAKELSIKPEEAGIQTDLIELRLNNCQLGLFGWEGEPSGKLIDKSIQISDTLEKELQTIIKDNRITCLECWDIAKKLKIKRLDVASACEKKGFKIKKCQLGAF